MTGDTPAYIEAIASALEAYGSAWRGDWSNCDGREIRNDLDGIADRLRSGEPQSYEELCRSLGVCHVRRSWPEHCDEKPDEKHWATCVHMTVEVDS